MSNKIRELRQGRKLRQIDLAKILNIRQNTLSNWETGKYEPDNEMLSKIAKYFNVTVDQILGREADAIIPHVRIPVLGTVPAGIALEAIEDVVDWEDIPESMCAGGKEYYGLVVKGDSMWPLILPGDTVIVRQTPECQSGDICVVMINGDEATLKEVKFRDGGRLTLLPRNPSYPPKTFSKEEIRDLPVSIAGVVVELRRKI